jgi:nicotinamide mononucleotide adenylyltransferase
MSFDTTKPTTLMLGRWQPWHDGHTELFKRALAETGQVCILTRNVGGIVGEDVGGGRTMVQDDNPFDIETVRKNIISALSEQGYTYRVEYIIINVPNIVDISYGRGVGYTITEHDLGKDIHDISATKIRKEMRLKGELK